MSRHLRWLVVCASALYLITASATLAYEGEVASQVNVNGPGGVECPATVPVTATVLDTNGQPLVGVTVEWSNGDSGVTDASGTATTSVALPAGETTVTATVGAAHGSVVLSCAGVLGATGLPRTDTEPERSPAWPLIAAGIAVLLGALGARRRRARSAA